MITISWAYIVSFVLILLYLFNWCLFMFFALSVVFTLIVISTVAYIIRKRNKRHKDFIYAHSRACRQMREINKTHRFHFINDTTLRHSYDDRAVYDAITPLDYLRYQLTYSWASVLNTLEFVEENRRMFFEYQNEIHNIESFGDFDADTHGYSMKKLLNDEKKLFDDLLRHPKTTYSIKVILKNVTVTGVKRTSKTQVFYPTEIRENIEAINKIDEYSKDNEIIESIYKVERAKVTRHMAEKIFERDGNKCLCCGKTENLEVDHIIPIDKGGKTEMYNLQTLCRDCNEKKGEDTTNYLPLDYYG